MITPEVEAIRDEMGFPGMKILQFAWAADGTNKDLPHNFVRNCIVYTGTHDNDTTMGWYSSASQQEQDYFRTYAHTDGVHAAHDMLRLALQSVAVLAIAPLQDIFQLPNAARMNLPGRAAGNWGWRYGAADLSPELAEFLRRQNLLYARWAAPPAAPAEEIKPIVAE